MRSLLVRNGLLTFVLALQPFWQGAASSAPAAAMTSPDLAGLDQGVRFIGPSDEFPAELPERIPPEGLKADQPIERTLKGGSSDLYSFRMNSGQYLRVVAEQMGIHVAMALYGPRGYGVIQVDSPNGTSGIEPLSWIARESGEYKLLVRNDDAFANLGKYRLRMEALRDSVPEDRRIMDALETYASGFHLSRRIFEEAQLNSLPRMEEAARKWRELGDTEREEQSVRTIAIIERQLGIIYVLRHAGPDLSRKWFEKALGWYRQTAERGDSEAETVMGDFYAFGWAVDQDFTQARQWYQKAAKQGHARAENNLGWLSQWGLGGKRDYRAAMRSYLKAAAEGNAVAKTNLGMMYRDGLGVAKNSAQAKEWFQKAAEQGDSRAKDLVSSLSELRTSN